MFILKPVFALNLHICTCLIYIIKYIYSHKQAVFYTLAEVFSHLGNLIPYTSFWRHPRQDWWQEGRKEFYPFSEKILKILNCLMLHSILILYLSICTYSLIILWIKTITNITLPQNNHTLNFISNRLIRPQFIAMGAAIKHECSCYMTPIEEQGIMGQD